MKTLSEKYEKIVNQYIKKFEKKQELEFDYWIGDRVGSVAGFGYYCVDFMDLMYDIDTNQPPKRYLDYYGTITPSSNYNNYCKDLRPPELIESKRIESLEKSKKNLELSKELFNQIIGV